MAYEKNNAGREKPAFMASAPWPSLLKPIEVDSMMGKQGVGYHLGGVVLLNPHISVIHQYVDSLL
jgi:hypothetical protein